VVEDGETGFLVPPQNPTALAGAILRLLRDPAQRERMGEAAARRVIESFDHSVTVNRFETLYTDLLQSAGGKAS
jgi:glycosyltransferase involved in cell wall biosynthesis